MKRVLTEAWYRGSPWLLLLLPLSWLFGVLADSRRRRALQRGPYRSQVPLIMVGNITVGGTGKTPVCIALAKHFSAQGKRVVIVGRGYGGSGAQYPLVVNADSDPAMAGDESVLLAQETNCAVVVDPNRVRAVQLAESQLGAELIISDDGLQHYALGRTLELAVVDGMRGLGNQQLLPAGPLREKASRLATVDIVIRNGMLQMPLSHAPAHQFDMTLQPLVLTNLRNGECLSLTQWQQRHGAVPVYAIAGTGNPRRFFASMRECGFVIMPRAFEDHQHYTEAMLEFAGETPVVMTGKDAIKCRRFAHDTWWALSAEARLPADFYFTMDKLLAKQSRD